MSTVTTRRTTTRTRAVLALLLLALVTAGCTSLPDSGPVVDADGASQVDQTEAAEVNAVPPARGALAVDVVLGFFKAMTAWPVDTEVASAYLSTPAARDWDPAASTVTYTGQLLPQDENLRVRLPLTDAELIDRDGAWRGRLPAPEQMLGLDLTVEDGQYRITNPPDALIVPESWFAQRYRQASVYFFDPSGRILVPEPVYVPRGEQLASTVTTRLLAGPSPALRRVTRSFLPPGLRVEVSVPVSPDGVATVPLAGEPGVQGPEAVERIFAQLAWTLRQDPAVRAIRVTVGEEVLQPPGGSDDYPVENADAYDPNGFPASADLYAVRAGALAVRDGNELSAVAGPFGTGELALEAATPNIEGSHAAGVTDGGTVLVSAAIESAASEAEEQVARPLLGTDLLPPAWDFADRIWVVDRTARGAVVHAVVDGRDRRLAVPGVSGRDVRAFLVSRDATRFVAVVRTPDGDRLRIGRIEVDDRGALDRVVRTEPILVQRGVQIRIRDIAWTSPTTIALLTPVDPGSVYEVRSVSVDGSPTGADALSTLTERVRGLAGSPMADLPTYGLTDTGLLDLTDGGSYGFVGDPATSIGYAG